MKKTFAALTLMFLVSCQDDYVTGNDVGKTTTLSARVERSEGVSLSLFDSAITVKVSLTAGSFLQTQTHPFADGGCDFTAVPVGVPYTLSFQGLNMSGTVIWSGTATGSTASSTTDGSVSPTTATVVVAPAITRDSTLFALSTNPGMFKSAFVRTVTNYVDSVAAGVISLTITATPSTPGDVSGITYNNQTSDVVTLNATDPTTIPVVVTNQNGNTLMYSIKVFHKAVISSLVPRDSTLSGLSTNPGTFTALFAHTTTTYMDSVAAGATSLTVTATANIPGDVSGITYNNQTSDVVTLNATDPTTIPVVVTNQNGNTLMYSIKVFHKAAITKNTFGIPWNTSVTYGILTDSRDSQSYRTVTIGAQVWMAENLNYAGIGSTVGVCYNSRTDSCTKYGRLYTWAEAMNGASPSSASPSGIQGVCPVGWHVPSDAEWTTMQSVVAPTDTTDGTKLKSTSGWSSSGNGTDAYGFRALPGGFIAGGPTDVGTGGYFWTATEDNYSTPTTVWRRSVLYDRANVSRYSGWGASFSLRCSQD